MCKGKCLSDLVRRVEFDRPPVGSDRWGKRGRPTNEAAAKQIIASETEAWDNSRSRYDNRIFGRGMKNTDELIMAKDDEDEGEPANRRSLLSRNGWELEKLSKLEAQHIDVCMYIGFCRDYPIVNRVGKIL